ncbi:MAG: DNA polymerase ligase N-terminal domain-containing protein [Gemmatimonadales bacterium]
MPTRTTHITRTARKHRASKKSKPLGDYQRKRDFTKTAEPEGASRGRKSARALRFVVQKHAASHLHFDFRLELDGVMKSWAVPKGPSYDPAVRRLAMEVEDHPTEYNTFEGTIPKGQYGGGTVMVWDRGTYEPEAGGGEQALRDGYDRGDLKFLLHGKRLVGGWVLVRMRRDESDRAQWLLIKHRDDTADASRDVVADEETSVATGRTMDEIGARARRVWTSNREPRSTTKPAAKSTAVATKQAARKKRPARAKRAASRSRA